MSRQVFYSDTDDFIRSFLESPRWRESIVGLDIKEAESAQFTSYPGYLSQKLIETFSEQGVPRLYSHQREAIDAIAAGKNLVISTGVASGKSLCYQIPILNELMLLPQSRSLLLFPTKALAQDQQTKLTSLLELLNDDLPKAAKLLTGIYDGDTPSDARSRIRKDAQILFSNPDMLHMGILPNHSLWMSFFAKLHFVVIDEVHMYRGVFGSHFANVLRRFKRIAALYGRKLQFICTSATLANARELAETLLEEPVTLIDKDGSPHGKRCFIILNPPMVDRELGIRRSALTESTALAKEFLFSPGQAIMFTGPRRSVEILYMHMLSRDIFADLIRSYRSGYLAEKRREIETELREGKIKLVISTNALELGIDIGGLDAVFLNGYPQTISATRQQSGRAGRKGNTALTIMIAAANPLDQYICTHPEYIFENNPEQALIDPDNPEILSRHLLCAIADMALKETDSFGRLEPENLFPHLQILLEDGKIRKAAGRFQIELNKFPAAEISLRNASNQMQLVCEGELIGYVDKESAFWMTHPGAIYLERGDTWLVKSLDLENDKVILEPIMTNYYTQPSRKTEIELLDLYIGKAVTHAKKYLGFVRVTTTITGFKKLRFLTQEVLGYAELDLPPSILETVAWWFSLAPDAVKRIKDKGLWNNEVNDYGKDWKRICAEVRDRDKHQCRHCGLAETDSAFAVHHITPFKRFDDPGEANKPENLVTLCPRCHRLAEASVLIQSGLAGLSYLLVNLAPFFVMCDRKDLDVFFEDESELGEGNPIVLIYDRVPGGIGLSRKLYELHDKLLGEALRLAKACPCENGCPSCTGPVAENGVGAKEQAIAILEELTRDEQISRLAD
ncbi:MAG TPA: DEAD/DEAH box helicase [Candidatus Cloacimonadota bacterium]|nr:DEAD/DEAH box helicase [Candidatus Cloacimonadota bacterium]